MRENDKGGIYSLAGFAYQIKVFILNILQLKNGDVLEYETIDDIALTISEKDFDKYEEKLCSVLTTDRKTAIQVKRTKVTKKVAKEVVKNWILADANNDNIDAFVLVTNRDTDIDIFSKIDMEAIFKEVATAVGKQSIESKVKLIGYSEEELKHKIINIIANATIQKYEDIDSEIIERFEAYFNRFGINEATYLFRLKELMQQITVDILDSVEKGQAYELTYKKVCQIKECITTKITDDKWEPNFSQFKKLNKMNLSDLATIKTREYQQLRECISLVDDDIYRYLLCGEYYLNSKRSYFELGMKELVDELEDTAYDNFCDVKQELRSRSADTPDNRLIETRNKSNAKAKDKQIKHGVCINLTSEDTDASIQISWKDENDE